ncbi:glycosyl transferase family protein [Halococcus thailandensis JCM 13552]|uniref:Glycosyl transferase family protein n=2 Tax=Halococcus thailandensis TaxID=335952 RepID=M0NB41_9EURY|nr:glycosyl transferase family protein [Halococcus thailandensis JCM 13552]
MYVYYVNLGGSSLGTWDEGVYATAARTAVEQGYWLLPHLHWGTEFQPFLEKTPLAIWLEAVSMLLFGTTAFAARIPSATATVLTAALLYVFGRDLFDRISGVGAAMVFLTIPYLYAGMNGGREGGTDMLFVLFGTVMAYFIWRYVSTQDRRPALLYAATAAAVLAVLTKGFAFGAFVLVVAPLIVRHWRRFLTRPTAIAATGGIICIALWPMYTFAVAGPEFIDEILIEQVIGRAGSGSDPNALISGLSYPYLRRAPDSLDPWGYVLPFAIGVWAVRAVRSRMAVEGWQITWLVWWGASVGVLFTFTGDHPWYLIPAYVPMSLIVGYLGGAAVNGARSAQVAVVGALGTVILISARTPRIGVLPDVLANTAGVYPGSSKGLLFAIAVTLLIGAILVASWDQLRSSLFSERWARAGGAVLILVVVMLLVTPPAVGTSNWDRTQAEHGAALDARIPSNAPIYVQSELRSGRPLFALDFYSSAHPLALAGADELRNNETIRYALVNSQMVDTLERPHKVVLTTHYHEGTNAANVSAVIFTSSSTRHAQSVRASTRKSVSDNNGFENQLLDSTL